MTHIPRLTMAARTAVALAIFVAVVGGCHQQQLIRFSAIYVDMDGTSLDSHNRVRPATVKALERFRRCGGQVGVATGRVLDQVKPYLDQLKPDLPVVLFNGAVTMSPDGKRTIWVEKLSPAALKKTLEATRTIEGIDVVILQQDARTLYDREAKEFFASLHGWNIHPDAIDADLYKASGGDAIKLLIFVEPARAEEVRKYLTAAVGDSARVVVTGSITLEVVAPKVTKARPIRAVLHDYHLDKRDLVTFGDSGNDVEMLRDLGLGVAMGNCRPEACKAATARIGSHDTDAIAHFIETAILTPQCIEQTADVK